MHRTFCAAVELPCLSRRLISPLAILMPRPPPSHWTESSESRLCRLVLSRRRRPSRSLSPSYSRPFLRHPQLFPLRQDPGHYPQLNLHLIRRLSQQRRYHSRRNPPRAIAQIRFPDQTRFRTHSVVFRRDHLPQYRHFD